MAEIDCDTWNDANCAGSQLLDDGPPDFIRAPPAFLCGDVEYTCSNSGDSPFPFHINADGSAGAEATLAVALVCAVIFSVILTTSGVFLWRNKKHLRKYLTCRTRSPTESRKGTPSAASTSDGSSDSTAYIDDIEYNLRKKQALLAAISSPLHHHHHHHHHQQSAGGVKFLTDSAIRYAPSQHHHYQTTHLTLDTGTGQPPHHQHIYEEIPNNYAAAAFYHPARYAAFRAGAAGIDASTPLSQQAFAQRQSWLDLLQRPPCPDMAFNLYDDGSRVAAACPNCYYPSLPRDSARMQQSDGRDEQQQTAARITVNPAETTVDRSSRRNRRHGHAAPYHYRGMLDPEHYQTTQALMNPPTVIRNEFPTCNQTFQPDSYCVDSRTRTLETASQRQQRRHKRNKCTNRPPGHPVQQTFSPVPQNFNLPESKAHQQGDMYALPEDLAISHTNCV